MAPITLQYLKTQKIVTFLDNTYTLNKDYTLASGNTLTINVNDTLMIPISNILTNNGTITNNGQIENKGLITNNGLITNTGTITNDGTIDLNMGTMVNSGSISNQKNGIMLTTPKGTMNNQSGAKLYNSGLIIIINMGVINNAGTITNSGTIKNNGTICGGTYTGSNPIGNPHKPSCPSADSLGDTEAPSITLQYLKTQKIVTFLDNTYTLQTNYIVPIGATLIIGSPSQQLLIPEKNILTNKGTIKITNTTSGGAAGMLTNNGELDNSGTIDNHPGATIVNNRTGKIYNSTGKITNSGSIINYQNGTINNTNGTINNSGSISNNSGTICGGTYTGIPPAGTLFQNSCPSADSLGDTESSTLDDLVNDKVLTHDSTANKYTLTTDYTLALGDTLNINKNATLLIPTQYTFTNNGTISNDYGAIINCGSLVNNQGKIDIATLSTLTNNATLQNDGTINIYNILTNNSSGKITNSSTGTIQFTNNQPDCNSQYPKLQSKVHLDNKGSINNKGNIKYSGPLDCMQCNGNTISGTDANFKCTATSLNLTSTPPVKKKIKKIRWLFNNRTGCRYVHSITME